MKAIFTLLLLFIGLNSFSQGCNSDVSICTQGVAGPFAFDQTTTGPPTDYADPVGCSTGSFGNDTGFGFILLYITQSGPLNLLVSGDATSGFIDVIVYDIPQGMEPCVAVLDANNEIGCNYATSSVGCTQFGNDFGCTSSVTAPNVVAGQTIMIIAHDYSTESTSFTLDLGSTGAQTGAPTPILNLPTSAVCIEDGNIQLDVSDLGGTWTGAGVSSTGVFDPVSAGVGVHTITYSIGTFPCNATVSSTIEVEVCNVPTCTVSSTVSTPICVGETFDLTASVVPGVLNYAWTGPGGFTSSNQNPSAIPSPASAGTYNYIVTASIAGATCTSTASLVVNALPNVSAGTDVSVCIGQSVTLSGNGANSYTWNNGVTNGNSFVPVGTNTFTVTGTNSNGCQNTDQVVVTVNPLPIVNAGLDQSVCQNNTVTLSGSGANTYTWDNGVVDNVGFQIGATTTYTVTGTDLNNCQNTDQITITVTPADVINAGSDFTVCENDIVTLTASGGQNPIWDNGVSDGVSFPALSTISYTVSNTDANGCSTTDQITITVNNLPAVNAGADQFVCLGDFVTLIANGALNYVWDNNVTDSQAFLPNFGLGGVDFTVIGTDANGCQNSDQVLVFVNDLPVVDAGLDQNVCQNSTITLSGNGALTYVWDNGVLDNVPFLIGATTTYTVTGTDGNNCQNTDQVTITITPADIINAGTDFAVCENESITLIATGGLNPIWDNNVTQGVSFVPVSTSIYTVSNTDANGCTTTDQITVTINNLPNIFAGNDLNICLNDVLILSGSGGNTYVWDNNVFDGIQFNQNVGSQLYTVVGTDINGCTNSDQINVTVNPLPTIDAGTNFSVCQNSQITLTGSGALNYAWNNGVLDNTPFNISQTTLFTVVGTDVNGCQNSDQIQVTVLNLPNVNTGNDIEICINNTVTLNGNGAVSYVWDNGISNNVSFTPLATNTYTVVGTDVNGCQNSDDVLVTVNPLPNVNAGPDLTICEGDAITLSGTGAQIYAWNNGAQNNVSFVPTTNQTYTVIGTDINGCVNSDELSLSINPIPMVSFIADLTLGCSPLNVLLTNTTPNSSNSIWTINGTEQIVAQNLNYSFLGAIDCYDISLTTSVNGCANTFSTTDFICVNPTPIALFDFTEEIVNEQLSNLVFFNNSQFATQYSWDFGDNSAFSNEENPIHEYFTSLLDEFNISLIATSEFGCIDSLTRTFKVREKLIYYVPNSFTPNGDELNNTFFPIFTSGFEPNSYHLTVYNRWGQIIFESLDYRVGWDGTFKNKMVEEGVYQWKIEFDTKLNQERKVIHGHVSLLK